MGKFFPPTLPEWHSAVVGFGAGFAFGAGDTDSGVARAAIRGVFDGDVETGHIAQARTEAAYAMSCFVLGAIVGKAWSARNA